MSLTGGSRNGVTQLIPLLDKVPPVAGVVGRRRRRPDMLFALTAATTTASTGDCCGGALSVQ